MVDVGYLVLLGRGEEVELAGRGRDEEGHGHGRRGLLELLAQVCRERRQLLLMLVLLMMLLLVLAQGEIFLIQPLRR